MSNTIEKIRVGNTDYDVGVSSWNDLPDKPFYSAETWVEVFPMQEIVGADIGDGMLGYSLNPGMLTATDSEIKVTFDGTDYECAMVVADGLALYGNASMMGMGDNTGEPFLVASLPGYMIAIVTPDANAHTASIIVNRVVYKTIDPNYLPDVVVYISMQEVIAGGTMYLYKDFAATQKCVKADIEDAAKSNVTIRVSIPGLMTCTTIAAIYDENWAEVMMYLNGKITSVYTAEYTPT